MKKTSKGFTLIELLAVIVILAIIALIATPMILGVIDSAKRGAAESSTYGYVEAIEKSNIQDMIDTGNYNLKKDGTYDLNDIGTVNYKGNNPKDICVEIEDGTVKSGMFHFDNYIVDYASGKAKVSKDKTKVSCTPPATASILPSGLEKGTAVYVNPETKSICDESNAVSISGTKTGCMKWYVYKDNKNGTYQLILDHNTTDKVAWNSSGDNGGGMNEVDISLKTDIITWDSSLKARLITADEIAEIVGATNDSTIKWNSLKPYGTIVDTQSSRIYFDGGRNSDPTTYSTSNGWWTPYASSTVQSHYAWMYDYTSGCTAYGCNINDVSNLGYWTSTPVIDQSRNAWEVNRDGTLNVNPVARDNAYGVRPVITL